MSHVRKCYSIRHLLSQYGAVSGYKLGTHILAGGKLATELTDLLLRVNIKGARVARILHDRRQVVLRLRDQTEQIAPPLLELSRRHHSLLSGRLVPRYHPLISAGYSYGLCGRMGRAMHLILNRLHG